MKYCWHSYLHKNCLMMFLPCLKKLNCSYCQQQTSFCLARELFHSPVWSLILYLLTWVNWLLLSLQFCLAKFYIFFQTQFLIPATWLSVYSTWGGSLVLKVWLYLFIGDLRLYTVYDKSLGGLSQFHLEGGKPLFMLGHM